MVVITPGAYEPGSVSQLFEKKAEFRKETIYFIVIDRFFNGNSANDGVSEKVLHEPSHSLWGHCWGGDLDGIIQSTRSGVGTPRRRTARLMAHR